MELARVTLYPPEEVAKNWESLWTARGSMYIILYKSQAVEAAFHSSSVNRKQMSFLSEIYIYNMKNMLISRL